MFRRELFLLGLLGLLVLNSQRVGDFFKEQIAVTIFLKNDAKEVEITQLKQSLAMAEYTKSAEYISKEQAAEEHSETIGENFTDYLGYNPLDILLILNMRYLRDLVPLR